MSETLEEAIIKNLDVSLFDKLFGIFKLGQRFTKAQRDEQEDYYRSNLQDLFLGIEGTDFYGYRIGEIIAEILKPDIVTNVQDVDLECLFEDRAYPNYQEFLHNLTEDLDNYRKNRKTNFWKIVHEEARNAISQKYIEGNKQLVEILHEISRKDSSKKAVIFRGQPELRYLSKNEADSTAKLFSFIEGESPRTGFNGFHQDLKNFMYSTMAHFGYKPVTTSRKRTDYIPQIKAMENKTLSLLFFDLPEGGRKYPIAVSFRAKTLRSVRSKVSRAYTALIALHQEEHIDTILESFPFELERLEKKDKNFSDAYRSIQEQVDRLDLGYSFEDKFTTRQRQANWKKSEITKAQKQMMWSQMDLETRSTIVENLGMSLVFQKYNTWQDVVNVFNDLIGMTLIYDDKEDFLHHLDHRVVSFLYKGNQLVTSYPTLRIVPKTIDPQSMVDIINRPGWKAAHFDLRMTNRNPTIPATEVHALSVEELARSDTPLAGEYAHSLRTKRIRSDFYEDVSLQNYGDIEHLLSRRVGEKRPRNALLSCVKERFKEVREIYSTLRFKKSKDYIT